LCTSLVKTNSLSFIIPEQVSVGGTVDVIGNVALEQDGVKERALLAESGADFAKDADEENGAVTGHWLVRDFFVITEGGRAFRDEVGQVADSSFGVKEGSFGALTDCGLAVGTQVVQAAVSGVRGGVHAVRITHRWVLSTGNWLFGCCRSTVSAAGGTSGVLLSC